MKNILLTILILSTATSKLMAYDASFSHARKYYAKKKYRHAEVLFMRAYKKEGDKEKKHKYYDLWLPLDIIKANLN